jgi:hypothetical protein
MGARGSIVTLSRELAYRWVITGFCGVAVLVGKWWFTRPGKAARVSTIVENIAPTNNYPERLFQIESLSRSIAQASV